MLALLRTFSWPALRHHPWRNAAAVLAVTLGVALAFSVHLINASALDEFASAVRALNGQADLQLRTRRGSLDEALLARLAQQPQVLLASPVLELQTLARTVPGNTRSTDDHDSHDNQAQDQSRPQPIQVLGLDALLLAQITPALMPRPAADAGRFAMLAPNTVFWNAAAQAALSGLSESTNSTLQLRSGAHWQTVQVAGTVAASGAPLLVMDIGAAQDFFGRLGQLSRIDLRLRAGSTQELSAAIQQWPDWPRDAVLQPPVDRGQQLDQLSRAYRVNLAVLALVALFTGAFLVFSVLALSVAQRAAQFALLGVLGLGPRQRLRLVLAESLLLGGVGSVLGIALGTALAALALRLLGGDLGGGYFNAAAPALQWSTPAALVYTVLGLLAALAGGWWPAYTAAQLPEAATLKGLGLVAPAHHHGLRRSLLLIAAALLLALAPPVYGVPLAAYLSIALLLLGGISALPWLTALLYDRLAPQLARHLLPLLAVERTRRMRGQAAVAISGVVTALSLAVALTVMVASFRGSLGDWLNSMLPADLYLRQAQNHNADAAPRYFSPPLLQALAQVPGVQRSQRQRSSPWQADPQRPAVTLIAQALGPDPARSLPLVAAALPVPPGQIGIYVSEAMRDLYQAQPGTEFPTLRQFFQDFEASSPMDKNNHAVFYVAGVWRDYARQTGAITLDAADFERLSGDPRSNGLALWLHPSANAAEVQQALRARAAAQPDSDIEIASSADIRQRSLRIFDRSFAVTYWLQAVAVAIGLFGVAASFSAQVLARRKEFGLLTHLGLQRRQILALLAGEGAAWSVIGSACGLLLGLAIAVVLVKVINPQSFHWSMDLQIPWLRLLALCAGLIAAGSATAWLAARSLAAHDTVLAVKEDW